MATTAPIIAYSSKADSAGDVFFAALCVNVTLYVIGKIKPYMISNGYFVIDLICIVNNLNNYFYNYS